MVVHPFSWRLIDGRGIDIFYAGVPVAHLLATFRSFFSHLHDSATPPKETGIGSLNDFVDFHRSKRNGFP